MKKIFLILAITLSIFAKEEPKILISKFIPEKYDKSVFERTTILLTESRLYLQKKFKKKVSFEYSDTNLKKKKEMKKLLKESNARYYAKTVIDIDEKKCKKQEDRISCKGKYIIEIFDGKKNRKKSFKTTVEIRNYKVAIIKPGNIKKTKKKIAKFLKKR